MADVRIPKDPDVRARLAQFAGLTPEERLALDLWCAEQQRESDARARRGAERSGDSPMAAPAPDLGVQENSEQGGPR
jgi:hypothetical protein